MNCAIISIYSTPQGMAATSRILAYSKGLNANGVFVTIYNPFPTDTVTGKKSMPKSGIWDGVNYKYTSGRYLSRYKIIRGIYRLSGLKRIIGYFTSTIVITKNNIKAKINVVIISTDSIRNLLFYSFVSKLIKSKSVFIFDEFPIPIRHELKNKIPKWKEFLYRCVLKNIDAYISISEELKQYYNKFQIKKTHILPVIVDVSRFEKQNKCIFELSNVKYLCYMGNLELSKDDVDNIIKAFALITDKYSSLKLYLYGCPKSSTIILLNNLIASLKLQKKVFLMGRVNSNLVPQILKQAYILVSSQPNTIRASGGFPTKLGEYLASGVPSLLTDVGENARYVKDGTHIFLSKPEDPTKYADKLKFIINNYEHSLKVAEHGKQYLFMNYSHIQKGLELSEFIYTV
jgi:glycosyltransferase involved in cell wall biosynthesis